MRLESKKENGMIARDYRPSFQVMSWFELSMGHTGIEISSELLFLLPWGNGQS